MKLNKEIIAVGVVFKNYEDMCSKLNITRYRTGSRQYTQQLNRLQAHFDFERVKGSHQIRITKVFTDDVICLAITKDRQQEALEVLKSYDLLG